MKSPWLRLLVLGVLSVALGLAGCGSGSDGAQGDPGPTGPQGPEGPEGPPGGTVIDLGTLPDAFMEELDVSSQITNISIASPPVVRFTLTSGGVPIVGLVPYWEASHSFVRFTLTKLVPGTNGDPDSWVSYTRGSSGGPSYDSGASLVDNGDGSYTFTFVTDVATVAGVPYEPTLTHRVAGQIGSSSVPLEPQNLWMDFVPAGGAVTNTRNIAVMESCNECHDNLVFHGRRFEVEYCVQCHNPDLGTDGVANFSHMIHGIHAARVLPDLGDFTEVTYPQQLANCRKCHNGADAATAQGDNWKNVPNKAACDGCHGVFEAGTHTGGAQADNSLCALCHSATKIEEYHTVPNATPNNPNLLPNERNITYELVEATVDGGNLATIKFKILSDGTALDVNNLPIDLAVAGRYPGFLFAYAMPQGPLLGVDPMDYNNLGNKSAQPPSRGVNLADTLVFDAGTGVMTATVQDAFPVGARLRAVGLQGYFQQDLNNDGNQDVSLHTPSDVVAVTGDDARRQVVDSAKCGQCHEWFEGHGGNRVYNIDICTLCHVPNLSSSGRQMNLAYPEDAQNLKDLVHGIHSSAFRTRDFEHVRIRGGNPYEYNWSEVTFPRGASTANCLLCHKTGTYRLPLDADLLPTTVRTTSVPDGNDPTTAAANGAFVTLPNDTDWINTPTASSCFYCHTSADAMAHMEQNGALLSEPFLGGFYTNRIDFGTTYESCAVCHGPGKLADLDVVHDR